MKTSVFRLRESTAKFSKRSEEHTSELQSRRDLVCRLLLALHPTDIYTLSLHDALPIFRQKPQVQYSTGAGWFAVSNAGLENFAVDSRRRNTLVFLDGETPWR